MDLEVIYEDENIVALNKPAGVLFDWVARDDQGPRGYQGYKSRPDLIPVHRLDKDTSGVILFAKNQVTADYLKGQFQKHEIKKTYLALVVGKMKQNRGVIDLPIARSAKNPTKRVAIGHQRGTLRESVTEYKVLKRFDGYTYVEVYPKTGRTHQIRSHFAAIGHPVVCDPLYAGKRLVCPGSLQRHFLHAKSIEFTSPSGLPDGKASGRARFEADLPQDLERTLLTIDKK